MAINLQGVKTLAIGAGLSVLPTLAEFVMKINWDEVVGTKYAFMVSGIVMMGMRLITKTPVFQQASSVDPSDSRLGGLQ
jgi:hypothetical protein